MEMANGGFPIIAPQNFLAPLAAFEVAAAQVLVAPLLAVGLAVPPVPPGPATSLSQGGGLPGVPQFAGLFGPAAAQPSRQAMAAEESTRQVQTSVI